MITGIVTSGTTFSSKAIVVCVPMWPPASWPSMIIASAPAAATRFASFTFGTTGITLMPAACNGSMKGTGLPAPKVTNAGFSSTMTARISSKFGAINIRFTPNGLSVKDLH